MASFSDLPYELVLGVFQACYSIQDAVRLSSSSFKCRDIWQQNIRNVSTTILGSMLPEYGDSLAFAKLEAQLIHDGDPPTHAWLSLILRNAKQADLVMYKWQSFLEQYPGYGSAQASVHQAYYTLRQLLLAWKCSELRPSTETRLAETQKEVLATTSELCCFLFNFTETKNQIIRQAGITSDQLAPGVDAGAVAWNYAVDTLDQIIEQQRKQLIAIEA